jgi:hypothetical protein
MSLQLIHADVCDLGETVERVTGIEPAWPAWKAGALPLSYTRGFLQRWGTKSVAECLAVAPPCRSAQPSAVSRSD